VSLRAFAEHLKVLEEAGLVNRSRDAQRRPAHPEAGERHRRRDSDKP
jgi:predicted transcriptional regulator